MQNARHRTAACALLLCTVIAGRADDPLPSWRDGAARARVLEFVGQVTTPGEHFVPEGDRIAVFDHDGTLWAEQPVYTQLAFVFDRVKELAPQHPEWSEVEPFKSVVEGDAERALAGGQQSVMELVAATHAGMTTTEFEDVVSAWIRDARHRVTKRPYPDMVYQPMLELLAYLEAKGFKNYIVSGGGADFIRPWSEAVYGIPREQVVGSGVRLEYEVTGEGPVLRRLPELDAVVEGAGKPTAIQTFIGRRPLVAFGNSDGDLQMLQWTAAGKGVRLVGLIHHTDARREWSYDRESQVGRLSRALDQARSAPWLIVDMREDWTAVYPETASPHDAE